MLDNPFSCRCVRRNCQESYFRKAIICPKMSLSDGRLFAAHGRICKFYPFPGSPPRRELWTATHPKRATKNRISEMQKTDRTAFLGYLTAPISGSAADGPSFSSSSHANHFSAAESYSPVRTISRAFSRISSHPVCRPSTVACTGISIHTPGVRVCGSSG